MRRIPYDKLGDWLMVAVILTIIALVFYYTLGRGAG